MATGTGDNSTERRVFRQHWLIKLALPGFPWLVAIVLISLAVFYSLPYSRYAPGLFALALFPFLKLLRLYLAWLGYSVSATAGSNVLVERSGLLSVSERLIPLTQFATVAYERPWWASILPIDVANAIVGAIGGPYVLPTMGDFSDLWQVLQSRGQVVPCKRPSALAILPGLLWRSAHVLLRLTFTGLSLLVSLLVSLGRSALVLSRLIFTGLPPLVSSLLVFGHTALDQLVKGLSDLASLVHRLRQARLHPAPFTGFSFTVDRLPGSPSAKARRLGLAALRHGGPDGGYFYKGVPFFSQTPSYAGFYAFCEQFILTDKNWTRWRYRARDSSRPYYPDGISDHIALFYLRRLRQACVLIPGPNGCSGERLSCRICSIEDIQHLAPDPPGPLSRAA